MSLGVPGCPCPLYLVLSLGRRQGAEFQMGLVLMSPDFRVSRHLQVDVIHVGHCRSIPIPNLDWDTRQILSENVKTVPNFSSRDARETRQSLRVLLAVTMSNALNFSSFERIGLRFLWLIREFGPCVALDFGLFVALQHVVGTFLKQGGADYRYRLLGE